MAGSGETAGSMPAAGRAARAPVVDIRALSLTYEAADGPVYALSNVDLQIEDGEFVSFIGPSGCGKTTLLRVIADLEQPSGGQIRVNGVSPNEARLRRDYGFIFQAPALYPWRTIERNVELPLEIFGALQIRTPGAVRIASSNSSTSRVSRRSIPGSSRAACSSGPPSPARSPSTRSSCSWTSRSARSTRSFAIA